VKRDLRTVVDAYVKLCLWHRTPPHVSELAMQLALAPSTLCKKFRALAGELP
jgi:DNA-binding MarR family transcriptional regulator